MPRRKANFDSSHSHPLRETDESRMDGRRGFLSLLVGVMIR